MKPPNSEQELYNEYSKFYSTGIVGNQMLLEFNQHGRWTGKSKTTPQNIVKMLTMTILSKEQIEETTELGYTILKTCFVEEQNKDTCEINYSEIKGNIYINQSKKVIAHNLEKCRNFYADRSQEVHLPKLKCSSANILARDAQSFQAPELLEAGTIHLDSIKSLELPAILKIRGDLILTYANQLYLNNCESIEKCLYCPCLQIINCPKLREIGSLEVRDSPTKTIATLFKTLTDKTLKELKQCETELKTGTNGSKKILELVSKELLKRDIRKLDDQGVYI